MVAFRDATCQACVPSYSIPIAQGPGPPQRPQVRAGLDEVDFTDAELTAKTLSVRAVFFEPQSGHAICWRVVIERTSFSNR